jgi:site-specific DNA recombinase
MGTAPLSPSHIEKAAHCSGSRAIVDRLRELEAREDELNARLSEAPVDIPYLHPNVAGICRRKVERLAEALRHPRSMRRPTNLRLMQ